MVLDNYLYTSSHRWERLHPPFVAHYFLDTKCVFVVQSRLQEALAIIPSVGDINPRCRDKRRGHPPGKALVEPP